MDIGTAKPSKQEQQRVPHWGLDLVEPNERFTAADFKIYALQKIHEIRKRGHVPFLVGGTGLYIDSVILDYQFGNGSSLELRTKLDSMSIAELQEYCRKNNVELPENSNNKRYLIRAIEQGGINEKRRSEPIENIIVVGIATDRNVLRTRIMDRTEQLFDDGVVKEAKKLGNKYGWNSEAMTANIYPLVYSYLNKEMSLEEIKDKFTTLDWRLAKRQITWLKRRDFIIWKTLEESYDYIDRELASE